MRTFVEKPKPTQQTASSKSTISGPAHIGHSQEANSILHLQRTIGNQAVQQILEANTGAVNGDSTTESTQISSPHTPNSTEIHTMLAISSPGDRFEREADTAADQVMRMPDPMLQRRCDSCSDSSAPSPSDEDKPQIQRLANGEGGAGEIASGFTSRLGATR